MLYLKPANFEDLDSEYEYVKEKCPKFYSQELIDHLFFDFYTKNEFLCKKLSITRNTASKYLHELTEAGILLEEKIGKHKIYKNGFLYNLIKLW